MRIRRENQGGAYLGFIIGFLIVMFLISVFMNVFPLYDVHSRLNTFGQEVMRVAELSGRIDIEVAQKEIAMQKITGLKPTLSWSHSGHVDIGEEIILTVEYTESIILMGMAWDIPMKISFTGRGEIYWK